MNMHIKGFLVTCILLMGMSAHAQWGARAGWQNSNIFYGDDDNADNIGSNLHSFYVGLYKNHEIGGRILTLNTGLEYSRVGWTDSDETYRKIDYVHIPIGVRVKVLFLFVQAGITPSINIGEDYRLLGIDVKNDDTEAGLFTLPAHIGAGVKLGPFVIDARYSIGLNKLNDDGRIGFFQFGGGIEF
ncbi:MAG: PorT family protein [Bacteroidetes bacterium]|nr:MAG: PorT family protein [Bacteroidota bacterium]